MYSRNKLVFPSISIAHISFRHILYFIPRRVNAVLLSTGIIESTTTLYMDRENHPSIKDLQTTRRLAESWKLHIFDTWFDFPVPVHSSG